jgi:hypothetical protein
MADTNEAQLLNDLLREIAREDACIDATHLEVRVMDAVGLREGGKPHTAYTQAFAIAAAIAVAVLAPAVALITRDVPAPTMAPKADATEQTIAEARSVVAQPSSRASITRLEPPKVPTRSPSHSTTTQSAFAQLRDEFVPLMPMTEQELTGPFQIVRVQMPRASLGTLRSPLEYPNELVEADVLLGEDGMARAIRVSTSGSVYPWRSR